MKTLTIIFVLLFLVADGTQAQTALPHGTVYGVKPTYGAPVDATKLDAFMGAKTRISTTLKGKILKVTQPKNGWFLLDGGNGRIIAAHFKNYGINIPAALAGRRVIVEGVAQKQFIADDSQHLAGDTVNGKRQHSVKSNPKNHITLEVTGMMVI